MAFTNGWYVLFILKYKIYTHSNLPTLEIRSKLNAQKYQRFNPEVLAKDIDEFVEADIGSVLLLVDQNTCITYNDYIQVSIALSFWFLYFALIWKHYLSLNNLYIFCGYVLFLLL